MTTASTTTIAAFAAALILPACGLGSHAPAEHEEYLVRARDQDAIQPSTERPLIRVAPVDVAPHVRGIAVVTEGGRVQTMVNQGFAAPVHSLVENAVVDRLRAAGRYGVVLGPGHPGSAPFVLRLSLRSFEVVAASSGYTAHVVFDGMLERDAERTVVRAFRASGDGPAEGAAHGGFVHGLEEALNAAIDVILHEIEAAGVIGSVPVMPVPGVPVPPGADSRGG